MIRFKNSKHDKVMKKANISKKLPKSETLCRVSRTVSNLPEVFQKYAKNVYHRVLQFPAFFKQTLLVIDSKIFISIKAPKFLQAFSKIL